MTTKIWPILRAGVLGGLLVGLVVSCLFTSKASQVFSGLLTQTAGVLAPVSRVRTHEYLVQPGDTPRGVALMYGTTVDTLIALNAQRYPEMGATPMKFNAGWRILVPAKANAPAAPGGSDSQAIQSSTTSSTGVPAAQSGPNGGYFDYDGALEIIQLTNAERAKAGLAPLTIDETLMGIARKRATEIATDWGHQGLDDDCPECGENITKYGNAARQFASWMNSNGHRGNILAAEYTVVGVGRFVANGQGYASEVFK